MGRPMEYTSNPEIRNAMKAYCIPFWKIGDKIGVHEGTLARWMRRELSEEKKTLIMAAINELKTV